MPSTALLPPDSGGVCPLQTPPRGIDHGIVSQALLVAPGLRATIFRLAAGQEMSEHTSSARVLLQVLSGGCEFTMQGQVHALKPGDLLHLPPRLPHAVRATSDLAFLLVQATPPGD